MHTKVPNIGIVVEIDYLVYLLVLQYSRLLPSWGRHYYWERHMPVDDIYANAQISLSKLRIKALINYKAARAPQVRTRTNTRLYHLDHLGYFLGIDTFKRHLYIH